MLGAFEDKQHPLAVGLSDLEERVELEKSGKLYRDAGRLATAPSAKADPFRHLFMPHPGVGDPEARRLWRLQLLLQTAARSPAHASRLAEKLLMHPTRLAEAADAAAIVSVARWSPGEYWTRLEEALETVTFPDPPLSFRIEGRAFTDESGRPCRLSPQEEKFLQLLVDHAGQSVTKTEFKEAGIMNPAKVKERLLGRLNKAGVELEIGAATGSYILPIARR